MIYLQEIDRLVGQTYTVVPRFSLSRFNGLSQFSASDRAWSHFESHIDVEAGFQSSKSTIAENGMGVTSRPLRTRPIEF